MNVILSYFGKHQNSIQNEKDKKSVHSVNSSIGSFHFTESKKSIEKILKEYTYSFNANDNLNEKNELEFYKNELDKNKKGLEEEDIIIYKNLMKMLEFIDKIKEEIKNSKIEKDILDKIILNCNGTEENNKNKYKIINCKYNINNLIDNKLDKKEYQDFDILNTEDNTKNFIAFLEMYKFVISASSITKNSVIDSSSHQTLNNINKVISPQNGIKIVKIGCHKNGKANFVKVLNENMIISGGDENIIFYDSGYNKKKKYQ